MDNQNTGSFGAATGGSGALMEAMKRRGIDAGAMQQMTPGSVAGGTPMPESPDMQAAQSALPQDAVTPPQQPDSELKIALQALGGFVKSEGSLRRDLVKSQQPTQPMGGM